MAEATHHDHGVENGKAFSLHYSSGPITALAAVFSDKVIAGCGNQLLIYNLQHLHLEGQREILRVASIHGICKGPTRKADRQLLCVYGAKEIRIVAVKKFENGDCELDSLTQVFTVYDWIWTVRWLTGEDEREPIAIALAHNSVAIWYWKDGRIANVRHCVENCILYSAHLIGETWDSLVLAAGTVFNQVVIWAVGDAGHDSEQATDRKAVPVIHSLAGHKGVIFSIQYHAEYQRLCSVSDDRSIQMWQLSFPGSRQKPPTVEDWKSVESVLLLTLFGHTARVWDAVLLTHCFASIGEDATCYVWNYDGKIISTFKGHKGRSIWSLAATEDEAALITGGGDSSVRMWEIQPEGSWSSAQQVVDIPQELTQIEGDFPRTICLLAFNTVLVMLNSGHFSSYSLTDHAWKTLFKDERFVSYSVVSPCGDQRKVAVGSITGAIKVLSIEDDSSSVPQAERNLFDGKVMGITWTTEDTLLISGPDGKCQLLTVTRDLEGSRTSLLITFNMNIFLPPSKHRWITAACTTDSQPIQVLVCGDKDGSLHCYRCSDPNFTSAADQEPSIAHPSQTFQRIHGKTGVTSVCFKDGLVYSTGRDGFYRQWEVKDDKLNLSHSVKVTKGFEWIDRLEWQDDDMLMYGFLSSYFVIWSVSCNQQLVSIPCGGGHRSWGCCFQDSALRFAFLKTGQIHVVDSQQGNKQSIVKHPLHGRELGDAKFMKLIKPENDTPGFLICTVSQDTTINVGTLSGRKSVMSWKPHLTLKGHLSSVRCVAISYPALEDSFCLNAKSGAQHTATAKSDSSASNYILFTGGGRAEIRVWKICASDETLTTCQNKIFPDASSSTSVKFNTQGLSSEKDHCEDSLPETPSQTNKSIENEDSLVSCTYEELSTHFLGESRHKSRFSNWKTRKLRLDPETRVMSLAATPLSDCLPFLTLKEGFQGAEIQERLGDLHVVSAAGSDGVLRTFSYDSCSKQLLSKAQSSLHKGCVLKVLHFLLKANGTDPVLCLLSTATNGCILIWSLSDIAHDILRTLLVKKQRKGEQRQVDDKREGETANTASDPDVDSVADLSNADDDDYVDFNASRENPEADTDPWQPIGSLKSHQSGINSISACHYKANFTLIASGGDDNALTVQLVELTQSKVNLLSKVTKADAHAAQITGVWLVSPSTVVSASIDQRICVWTLEAETRGVLKLTMLKCKYIHIADASSMDVCVHGDSIYVLIGGEGLCLYDFR